MKKVNSNVLQLKYSAKLVAEFVYLLTAFVEKNWLQIKHHTNATPTLANNKTAQPEKLIRSREIY